MSSKKWKVSTASLSSLRRRYRRPCPSRSLINKQDRIRCRRPSPFPRLPLTRRGCHLSISKIECSVAVLLHSLAYLSLASVALINQQDRICCRRPSPLSRLPLTRRPTPSLSLPAPPSPSLPALPWLCQSPLRFRSNFRYRITACAHLNLDPKLALASKVSDIALALRSLADATDAARTTSCVGECGSSLCVNLCVNFYGRFNLERGMETRLVKEFLQAIYRDELIVVHNLQKKPVRKALRCSVSDLSTLIVAPSSIFFK
ncbi:hypothetical protein ACFE04_002050 [Oxalis oulophora]